MHEGLAVENYRYNYGCPINSLLEYEDMNKLIPILKKAIVASFDAGDWKEIAYGIEAPQIINNHNRLLRSLSWGDDDYESSIFEVLESIMLHDNYPDDYRVFLNNEKIKKWIKENQPKAYQSFYNDFNYVKEFTEVSVTAREVVETALKDAGVLIHSTGAVSAVDRIHTALHGYLLAQCDEYSINYKKSDGITQLYKLLSKNADSLKKIESSGTEISRIIKAISTIFHSINIVRNHNSVAHPTENLLGEDEAILVINITRTLLHYLDAKL